MEKGEKRKRMDKEETEREGLRRDEERKRERWKRRGGVKREEGERGERCALDKKRIIGKGEKETNVASKLMRTVISMKEKFREKIDYSN